MIPFTFVWLRLSSLICGPSRRHIGHKSAAVADENEDSPAEGFSPRCGAAHPACEREVSQAVELDHRHLDSSFFKCGKICLGNTAVGDQMMHTRRRRDRR